MHVLIEDAFSSDQCRRIRDLASGGMAGGPVFRGSTYEIDPAVRDVAMRPIPPGGPDDWIFARLDALAAIAADRLGVAVAPASEALQLLRYDPGGHFQQWHSDAGIDAVDRRLLSVSVELSDPADYDGGDLEIAPVLMGSSARPQGSARFFFSRLLHHVTPVTRGTRWALVAWIGAARG